MTRFFAWTSSIPRWVLYSAAALVQITLVVVMVADRAGILREGREVTIQTRPVDPRDWLRGDYVTLSYAISSLPAGVLKDKRSQGRNTPIFVKLAPNAEGLYELVSVHDAPPAVTGAEAVMQGRVTYGATCGTERRAFCERLTVAYGLERYFVPEGEGREIEKARDQRKVSIVAAVMPSGRAAIKRLLVDGKPVYDEPWF